MLKFTRRNYHRIIDDPIDYAIYIIENQTLVGKLDKEILRLLSGLFDMSSLFYSLYLVAIYRITKTFVS